MLLRIFRKSSFRLRKLQILHSSVCILSQPQHQNAERHRMPKWWTWSEQHFLVLVHIHFCVQSLGPTSALCMEESHAELRPFKTLDMFKQLKLMTKNKRKKPQRCNMQRSKISTVVSLYISTHNSHKVSEKELPHSLDSCYLKQNFHYFRVSHILHL